MTYTLQAIVAKKGTLASKSAEDIYLVSLDQDYELLPFTNDFIDQYQVPPLPLTGDETEALPESIVKLCTVLSEENTLAYVEAEYFGGHGMQAAAVFKDGQLVGVVIIDEFAINHALRLLGVSKNAQSDEFEAVGLSRHRNTNEWITTSASH